MTVTIYNYNHYNFEKKNFGQTMSKVKKFLNFGKVFSFFQAKWLLLWLVL